MLFEQSIKKEDIFLRNTLSKGRMLTILFRTTSDCNMNCIYCYQHKTEHTKMNINHIPLMKTKIKSRIQEQIKKYDRDFYIKLSFVGGEVSINDINVDIFKMFEEIYREINLQLTVNVEVLTNGYYMNKTFIDFLEYMNSSAIKPILDIYTSIDFSKEIHNKNRISINQNGTYDQVISNISFLLNQGYHVVCNAVLNQYIIDNYTPEYIFNSFINTFDYSNTSYEINAQYEFSLQNKLTKQQKNFLESMFKLQYERMNDILNCKTDKISRFILLHLNGLSYMLCYYKRVFCDIENCYNIEAIDENNLVFSSCHEYTFKNHKENYFELERTNANVINFNKALYDSLYQNRCVNCELAPFCRQKCFRFNPDNLECIPVNRTIALITLKYVSQIFKLDNFYEKYLVYLKKYGDKNEYESWNANQKFWKERIKYIIKLGEKYE